VSFHALNNNLIVVPYLLYYHPPDVVSIGKNIQKTTTSSIFSVNTGLDVVVTLLLSFYDKTTNFIIL